MKLNLYKYVLMGMTALIGFHLVNVINTESYIFMYLMETDPFYLGHIADMRLQIMFSNILLIIFCIILVIIAIGIFFGEKYFLKYIENRRK